MSKTVRIGGDGDGSVSAAEEKAQAFIGTAVAERYLVEALLAVSESGAIFRVKHVHLRTPMALKVLFAEASAAEVMRFEREAVAGAHVRHPNVASVTDSGTLPTGARYLALEHVSGVTLREVLKKGSMPQVRALSIAHQIALALGAAHDKGVVHGSVEPGNVMLTGDSGDEVRLLDFSRAKMDAEKFDPQRVGGGDDYAEDLWSKTLVLTLVGPNEGTTAYLPPEASLGPSALDPRADLYALGVVFFEMLAGKRPFDADSPAQLFAEQRDKPAPSVAARAVEPVIVSPTVEHVVQRLLARSRDDRFATAAAAAAALDQAARFEGRSDSADGRRPDPKPSVERARPGVSGVHGSGYPVLLGRRSAPKSSIGRVARAARDLVSDGVHAVRRLATPPRSAIAQARRERQRAGRAEGIAPRSGVDTPEPVGAGDRSSESATLLREPPRTLAAEPRAPSSNAGVTRALHEARDAVWQNRVMILGVLGTIAGIVVVILIARSGSDESAAASETPAASAASVVSRPSAAASEAISVAPIAPIASSGEGVVSIAPAARPTTVDGLDAVKWRAELTSVSETQNWQKAAKAVHALVEIDPPTFDDPSVSAGVVSTACALAGSHVAAEADPLFDVLTNKLGDRGLWILFEIVRTRGASKGSERAVKILGDPAVAARAPDDLRVAFQIVQKPCSEKGSLFAEAGEKGGAQTLVVLRSMREMECPRRNPGPCCFKGNAELDAAVARLKERVGKP